MKGKIFFTLLLIWCGINTNVLAYKLDGYLQGKGLRLEGNIYIFPQPWFRLSVGTTACAYYDNLYEENQQSASSKNVDYCSFDGLLGSG